LNLTLKDSFMHVLALGCDGGQVVLIGGA
jgi:hypothetical protein